MICATCSIFIKMYKFLSRAAITASIHLKYCVSGFQQKKAYIKLPYPTLPSVCSCCVACTLRWPQVQVINFAHRSTKESKEKKIWKKAKIKIKKKNFPFNFYLTLHVCVLHMSHNKASNQMWLVSFSNCFIYAVNA